MFSSSTPDVLKSLQILTHGYESHGHRRGCPCRECAQRSIKAFKKTLGYVALAEKRRNYFFQLLFQIAHGYQYSAAFALLVKVIEKRNEFLQVGMGVKEASRFVHCGVVNLWQRKMSDQIDGSIRTSNVVMVEGFTGRGQMG